MLDLTKLKLFPFRAKSVSIPVNEEQSYNIIFLSENSDFVSTYPKLRIRRQYAKKVTAVSFKVPRLIITMKYLMLYKSVGLLPATEKEENNVFVDTTPFFSVLDKAYGKGSYRRPMILSKAVSYLNQSKNVGENKKNILMFHTDLSKPIAPELINRRSVILAMIARLGDGAFPFDCVVLATEIGGSMSFSSIYNKTIKHFQAGKIISILKQIKPEEEKKKIITSVAPPIVDEEPKSDEQKSIIKTIDQYQKQRIL